MPWMCFLPISTTLTVTTITIGNSDITSVHYSLEADAPEEQAQTHSLALLLVGDKTINEKYFSVF